MTNRACIALLAVLAVVGWMATAFGLALAWVAGRFFAGIMGWT